MLRKGLDWNTLLLLPVENYLPAAFLEKLEELRLMPLYELLEELFSIFEMNRISDQDAYLFAFFDAVTDYLQSNSSELDGFIRYWDETLCGKTIPSGEVEALDTFSQEELFTRTYYPWVGGSCIGNYFISNTSSHYDWAMKKMKAHKKRVG